MIELVRHSVAQEVLVYPQVKSKVSEAEAERARKEHAAAEEHCTGWRSSIPTTRFADLDHVLAVEDV